MFGFQAWHGDDDASAFKGVNGRPTFRLLNLLELVQDRPFSQSGPAYDPLSGEAGTAPTRT